MNGMYFSYKEIDKVENWEEALYKAAADALHSKVITALYLKEVVDVVEQAKTMLVINDDTVLLHAEPSENVRKDCLCYLKLDESVGFFNKKVKHVFLFGARTPDYHLKLLKWITKFTMEASTSHKLYERDLIHGYFTKAFEHVMP
ncbi:MAG: PTS sugar transporter subunit IIA [Candidatus Izemoplasmataceae bacterium]|uniref:PTS sugar transporter subunit IIA n=1 Tax=Liberiplasma polymorphum TaxID=3374570 RepID=UPI00377624D9